MERDGQAQFKNPTAKVFKVCLAILGQYAFKG